MRAEAGAGKPADARGRRLAAAALLAALYCLHQDIWFWHDARLVFGLPVGLAYHVAFCLAVSAALLLAVRWAWPPAVPVGGAGDGGPGPSEGEVTAGGPTPAATPGAGRGGAEAVIEDSPA